MLRLRTTTALSLLALGVGVAGTIMLSAQTPQGAYARARTAQTDLHAHAHAPGNIVTRHSRLLALRPAHVAHRPLPAPPLPHGPASHLQPPAIATAELPTLRPLSMPAAAAPFEQLRGHLSGAVALRLDVDGAGRVRSAAMSRSSGDAVLDAHALRMVREWRFAVPADHPDGISGELPMRFESVDRLAAAR